MQRVIQVSMHWSKIQVKICLKPQDKNRNFQIIHRFISVRKKEDQKYTLKALIINWITGFMLQSLRLSDPQVKLYTQKKSLTIQSNQMHTCYVLLSKILISRNSEKQIDKCCHKADCAVRSLYTYACSVTGGET